MDPVGAAVPGQDLDRHRTVVGEPAVPFGAGGVQSGEGFVQLTGYGHGDSALLSGISSLHSKETI